MNRFLSIWLSFISAFDNYFLQAQRVRKLVQKDFNSVFRIPNPLSISSFDSKATKVAEEGVDILIHPSSVDIAPTISSATDQSQMSSPSPYVQDVLTVPASLAGIPSLSIPAGKASEDEKVENGWPVGITITSQFGCEKVLWKVARLLEVDT